METALRCSACSVGHAVLGVATPKRVAIGARAHVVDAKNIFDGEGLQVGAKKIPCRPRAELDARRKKLCSSRYMTCVRRSEGSF